MEQNMKKTKSDIQLAAAILGRAGRGASKRRGIDYAELARKSHAARLRNKTIKKAACIVLDIVGGVLVIVIPVVVKCILDPL